MGFTFDGIHSDAMGIDVRFEDWQIFPNLRNQYDLLSGRAGKIDYGTEYGQREITIYGVLEPQADFSATLSKLDALAAWLNPYKGACMLKLDAVDGRYFMAQVQDQVSFDKISPTAGTFVIRFVCADPFSYAIEDEIFSFNSVGVKSVTRYKGNLKSKPIYELRGVISQSGANYFKIVVNGSDEIKVYGPLDSSQTLVIDSEKMTAKVIDSASGDVVRNGLAQLETLTFPELVPSINSIEIIANNGTFNSLKVYCRSRWI